MPPCPGKSLPESLSPDARFTEDSTRSPIMANALSTAPMMDRRKLGLRSSPSGSMPSRPDSNTTSWKLSNPALSLSVRTKSKSKYALDLLTLSPKSMLKMKG
eukprot:CAMPEP_0178483558 /NCGR_PEP_ID=MMETSP0696-20121128/7298_1 /TAXON_ID=265572 /ORGANISM="Extubocellulus spinifer, Strain CCMP396" /LENGTH=101 /DNA_ID=CAMNT_0020111083 /DNA_START=162 /DNA_END=467 /DNA_ORIENTATION=-